MQNRRQSKNLLPLRLLDIGLDTVALCGGEWGAYSVTALTLKIFGHHVTKHSHSSQVLTTCKCFCIEFNAVKYDFVPAAKQRRVPQPPPAQRNQRPVLTMQTVQKTLVTTQPKAQIRRPKARIILLKAQTKRRKVRIILVKLQIRRRKVQIILLKAQIRKRKVQIILVKVQIRRRKVQITLVKVQIRSRKVQIILVKA
jgi:hypothetical protein